MVVMTTSMNTDNRTPITLSTGDDQFDALNALDTMLNPMSITPDGVMFWCPDASAPIVLSDLMISLAISGPFFRSHKKNPKKIMNLMSSTKNSPISAFLKSIKPNVQDRDMVPSVKNKYVACCSMTVAHDAALLWNSSATPSRTPSLVTCAIEVSQSRKSDANTTHGHNKREVIVRTPKYFLAFLFFLFSVQ